MAEETEAVSDWEDVPSVAYAQPQSGGWEDVPAQPQIDPTDTANIVTMQNPHGQGLKQTAEDYMTRAAHHLSFGQVEKASAKLNEWMGKGTYEENLAKNDAAQAEAAKRIGGTGDVLSALAGGGLAASGLANAGVTVAGRLAPTAGIIPRTLAGGIEGAGYGAAYGAGNTRGDNPQDYVNNTIEGAKTGGLVGAAAPAALSVISRGITPAPAQSAERLRQAQALQAAGVPVTAADRTGSVALAKLEDQTAKMPLGTLFANPAHGQMEALTARAAEKSGIAAGEIPTAKVLADTSQKVGGTIGRIQEKYPIAPHPELLQDVLGIAQDIPLLLPTRQGNAAHFLNKLVTPEGLAPAEASAMRSQLRRAINGQNGPNGDKEYQGVLIDIRKALDDALERTVQNSGAQKLERSFGGPANDLEVLKTARQQYANLNVLQDALYRSGAQGQLGVLTPTALQAAQASSLGKAGYMQGRGDLTELAKGSSGLLRSPQDSGTASNVATMNPLKWAASLGGQALITNPIAQRYWGNQLLPQGAANEATGPVIGGLLAARDAQQRRKGLLSP